MNILAYKMVLLWLLDQKTVLQNSISQMTSSPENLAVFLRKINKCLPICIIQFQVAFLDATADCIEWQWFCKVLPSPCGYVYHDGFSDNTAWGLDGQAHSASVSALGLYALIFPPNPWIFSRYCELWMVKDWKIIFELTDNSLMKFGTKCLTTTHPCMQRLSLWWMLLLYSV